MQTKEKVITILFIALFIWAIWDNTNKQDNYFKDRNYNDGYEDYMYEFEEILNDEHVCRKKEIIKAYKQLYSFEDSNEIYGIYFHQNDIDTFNKIIKLFDNNYNDYVIPREPKYEDKYMNLGEQGAKEDIEKFLTEHGNDFVYCSNAIEWISNHIRELGSEELSFVLDYGDYPDSYIENCVNIDDIEREHEHRE